MTKLLTKEIFGAEIRAAESIAILGHLKPDGDSIGSVLGAWNYVRALRGEDFPLRAYLDDPSDKFAYLRGFSEAGRVNDKAHYALVIVCDCADTERMGKFRGIWEKAGKSILIDHHLTNEGFGDFALIEAEASSASELLYTLLEDEYFNYDTAACIYTGIVHDTGVFRYSCTHRETMEIAGRCIGMGIPFGSIIEDTFFGMTPVQKRVLGYILSNMRYFFDGRFTAAFVSMDTLRSLDAVGVDMDGMIDQLRSTSGVSAALFMYETASGRMRASLRSNCDEVDVSRVALSYGGGGHKRAAGCFVPGDFETELQSIAEMIGTQLGV